MIKRILNSIRWRAFYAGKPLRKWWQEAAVRSAPLERELLSYRFLEGDGLEIGALSRPLPVCPAARVRYVDRMAVPDLLKQYPDLRGQPLVRVDVVDDGETLRTVPDGSQDFVIANHFLEHCQDPLSTAGNMARVLRQGGVLYLAIPEKRFTFDRNRPPTPLEHLLRDCEEGPEWSKRAHFEEWVRLVEGRKGEVEIAGRVQRLLNKDYSIHFHVWTQLELLELVRYLMHKHSLELEAFVKNGIECVIVLRKIASWAPVPEAGSNGRAAEPASDSVEALAH